MQHHTQMSLHIHAPPSSFWVGEEKAFFCEESDEKDASEMQEKVRERR